MDARPLSSLEQRTGWIPEPIHEYHVELWFQPEPGNMWSVAEYRLTNAEDAQEAIGWAETRAAADGATYALYAVVEDRGEGKVWLAGINPTSARGNFNRERPSVAGSG